METVLKDLGKYKSNILTSLLNSDDIKDIITDGKYDEDEFRSLSLGRNCRPLWKYRKICRKW